MTVLISVGCVESNHRGCTNSSDSLSCRQGSTLRVRKVMRVTGKLRYYISKQEESFSLHKISHFTFLHLFSLCTLLERKFVLAIYTEHASSEEGNSHPNSLVSICLLQIQNSALQRQATRLILNLFKTFHVVFYDAV
jgi:hypothetical protein